MTEDSAQHQSPRRSISDRIGLLIVLALVVGLFSAPIYALVSSRSTDKHGVSTMGDIGGRPVELATLPPALAELYRGAESHASHFEEIPCFCGCQEGRLQHRNLLDCYVLRDGRGWESHATGCEVCQGEAEMALDLLARGHPIGDVRNQIIDEYGMPQEMRDLQEG